MLGSLQMDIETCIQEYLNIAPEVFPVEDAIGGSTVGRLLKVARGLQRFNPEPLETAMKRLVMKYLKARATAGEDTLFRFESSTSEETRSCKVLVNPTLCIKDLGLQFTDSCV